MAQEARRWSVGRKLLSLVPASLQPRVRRLYYAVRSRMYAGNNVFCVCCNGQFRSFLPYGTRKRPGAQCPRCGSLERHRLLWLYLKEKTSLSNESLRVLHIAPEPCFARALASMPNLEYITADLRSPHAMVRFDVTDIPYPDGYFDVILCHHVLEHVSHDVTAMRELRRVCRPGGWAILQVPVNPDLEQTFEESSARTADERTRLFGQHDHVRSYGKDYPERLRSAGWHVHVERYADELGERMIRRHGLTADHDQDIFFCTVPALSRALSRSERAMNGSDELSERADLLGAG